MNDAEQAVEMLTRLIVTAARESDDRRGRLTDADQLGQLISTANPEQAKELLRLLIKDIGVHDQHTIIPIYRIPHAVRTMHETVGDPGLEPGTSSLSEAS